jgi:hypothetical protein
MKTLQYRSTKKAMITDEREYIDAQERLVGKRVQADLPCSKGGYQRGYVRQLTRDRQTLVECDGSYGIIWCDLSLITILEQH